MQAERQTEQHVSVRIIDLACGGGAQAVERALAQVPGVKDVYVNPLTEMAYLTLGREPIDGAAITHAIEQTGCRAGPFRAQ